VGAVSVILTASYAVIKGLSSLFGKLKSISTNVALLIETHIPQMQSGIAGMRTDFDGVKGDVREMRVTVAAVQERMDDNKQSLDTFGAAFLQHLENGNKRRAEESKLAAETPAPKRKRRAAHGTDLTVA
jgi:hypothetical protein